jgi:hypothetical protein
MSALDITLKKKHLHLDLYLIYKTHAILIIKHVKFVLVLNRVLKNKKTFSNISFIM